MIKKLPSVFYLSEDILHLTRSLLGKVLCTCFRGVLTKGMIIEAEAYRGPDDRGSHAYGNLRSARTEPMFLTGGRAYIYLCYGIHQMFNVVTGPANIPHAILIRALYPLQGVDAMQKRRGSKVPFNKLCDGPGKLGQAMGFHTSMSGIELSGHQIWIEDHGITISKQDFEQRPRIGIDYAGKDALLPWRFVVLHPATIIKSIS